MNAASTVMMGQRVSANNIANASTYGFKSDQPFSVSRPVVGDGFGSRAYASLSDTPVTDFSNGMLEATGNDMDLAINGNGFFVVQAPDGSTAYTRRGDLHVLPTGQLVNGVGHPVMGNGGPIAIPPFQKIEFGNDGTITFQGLGDEPKANVVIDRIGLVKAQPEQMIKRPDGLFETRDGSSLPLDADVTVVSGGLERSNVNTMNELAKMIEAQRQFEMTTNLMRQAGENAATATTLLRTQQ